jgi:hypothetical protein
MRSMTLTLAAMILVAAATAHAAGTDKDRFDKLADKYVLNEFTEFKPKVSCVCTKAGEVGYLQQGYLFRSVMFTTGLRCAIPDFDEAGTFAGSSVICEQYEILPK